MIEPLDVIAHTRKGKRDSAIAAAGVQHACRRRQQLDEGSDDLGVPLGRVRPASPSAPRLA